jgi:leucyl/phenylalanyl-tRNA--protein transferase
MFSTRRDASKVALVHLVGRLIAGGYGLLDAQFMTDHLAQFGAIEMARPDYRRALAQALPLQADFYRLAPLAGAGAGDAGAEGAGVLQAITQTS